QVSMTVYFAPEIGRSHTGIDEKMPPQPFSGSVPVGHPGFDRPLDLIRGEMLPIGAFEQRRQFLVRREAKRHDLPIREPRKRGLLSRSQEPGAARSHFELDDPVLQPCGVAAADQKEDDYRSRKAPKANCEPQSAADSEPSQRKADDCDQYEQEP